MALRNVGVPFSFEDHTRPVSGDEGESMRQSDRKLVTRSGAAKEVADIDVNKDIVTDGDFETEIIDIGGTSGIAIALDSADGNSFEVKIGLYDDDDNLRSTLDTADYPSLENTSITEVYPVFSDRVKITITDTSGGTNNTVTGSINANIGTPSRLTSTISSGRIQIAGADDDTFEDEQLNSPVDNTAAAQVTYLARALNSTSLDEFVTRVTDSGGVQIDPLTQDVTQTLSNDEVRTRLYGVDTSDTLVDVNVAELGTGVGASRVAQLTYLARALHSQSLDEFVARVTDSTGTQIDPLTQDVTQTLSNDEVRTRLYGVDTSDTLVDVNVAELGTGVGTSRVAQLTYLARALNSQSLDEFVARVTDSTGTQIDPLTQAVTASAAGDQVRVDLENHNAGTLPVEQQSPVALEGDDDDGNTLNVNAETLGQGIADPDALVTYIARALNSQGFDELVSRLTDATGTQVNPATNDDQPNWFDDDIVSYDLVGSGDYTIAEPNIRGTGDVVVKVNSADTSTFTVTLEWTDGAGNVLYTQSPPEATDVTDANLKFNVSSDHFQLRISDTSGGASNNINGTVNVH